MPSRRFWALERQINRIRAEGDLRQISVSAALNTNEGARSTTERLVLELGETTQIERNLIVKGDRDRNAKFARVMG